MNAADRPLCLPGTRQDLLKEIIQWLMTPSDQNILWLHGAAGLGKSTLSTTIAEYFGGLRRRGAFLFFDRNSPIESAPSRVISTLAYQLAEQDKDICFAIAAAIERRPQLTSDPIGSQFTSLLLEPLSAAAAQIEGPVIIILDALDECGDASSRRALLALLSRDLSKLPRQFRFLITSRPEHDLKGALASRSHVHAVDISTASDPDMLLYITHEMQRIYSDRYDTDELPVDWPGEMAIRTLVAYAAGLFIWAATAMNLLFITEAPVLWLADLLRRDRQVFTLHELYKTALLSVSKWEPGETTDAYRRILGMIVISQEPLCDEAIADLLGLEDSGRTCRTALQRLGCVIQWGKGRPARTFHKSFPDYLINRDLCSAEPWFIDVAEHQHALTARCLRILNERLRFNMCDLKTSHIPNSDVMDLPAHIQAAIPQSISYSCRFWGNYLYKSHPGDSIADSILQFFEQKFLYWLEVLSLMGEVQMVSYTLVAVADYATVRNTYHC